MSVTESDTVESSSSPNTNYPIKRLNNFDLRLQVLSHTLNNGLVCITCHHDANKAQFDFVNVSVSNLNSMYGQLTQCQFTFEQQTRAINQKIDLLLKHLGKHEIGEYVEDTIRKHIRSTHIGDSSHYGGSPQYDELTNGLHDNLGKMNFSSDSIAQPHIRLPAI